MGLAGISCGFYMIIYDSIFNFHLMYIALRIFCYVVVIITIFVFLALFPFNPTILPGF